MCFTARERSSGTGSQSTVSTPDLLNQGARRPHPATFYNLSFDQRVTFIIQLYDSVIQWKALQHTSVPILSEIIERSHLNIIMFSCILGCKNIRKCIPTMFYPVSPHCFLHLKRCLKKDSSKLHHYH